MCLQTGQTNFSPKVYPIEAQITGTSAGSNKLHSVRGQIQIQDWSDLVHRPPTEIMGDGESV
ncbi:MAG: hypothetical protein CMM07_00490 [Rhodopirellula sp.]|nr:hypothetical protein [Rhodopirellula sp.]